MGPRFLEIELTGRCQFRCKHCYGSFPFNEELPQRKIEQIIDQAREDFDCLILSGGEPFMHKDLIELIQYADKKGFSVHITTSGYSIPKDTIDSLSNNTILVFGLDGIGWVHDEYRGKRGVYDRLLETMEYSKNKLKEIITTLWKGNLRQLEEITRLAKNYRAALHFNALIPVGRAKDNPEILLTRKENEIVQREIADLKRKFGIIFTDHYKITEKDIHEGIDLFCKGRFSIDPGGDVHPCEFLRSISFGNVFEKDLSEIIREAKKTGFIQAREEGFKHQVSLNIPNPFDYHTHICHVFAKQGLAKQ